MPIDLPPHWITGDSLTRDLGRQDPGLTTLPPRDWQHAIARPGALTVIAGRPAMGRTAITLQLLRTFAVDGGRPAALVSTLEPSSTLVQRLLSGLSEVPVGRIRTRCLTDAARAELACAEERLTTSPLYLDCTRALTPEELRERLLELHTRAGPLEIVIIDDPEELHGDSPWPMLEALAVELQCPVVATARLGRSVELREEHRPRPKDLTDRLARRHASTLLLLYREEYYSTEPLEPGVMEVFVEQREGPTWSLFRLECCFATGTFHEVPEADLSTDCEAC